MNNTVGMISYFLISILSKKENIEDYNLSKLYYNNLSYIDKIKLSYSDILPIINILKSNNSYYHLRDNIILKKQLIQLIYKYKDQIIEEFNIYNSITYTSFDKQLIPVNIINRLLIFIKIIKYIEKPYESENYYEFTIKSISNSLK